MTVDCLIATCISEQHSLLHRDRDFDPSEKLLDLSVILTICDYRDFALGTACTLTLIDKSASAAMRVVVVERRCATESS